MPNGFVRQHNPVGGLRLYRDSIFFYLLSFCQLPFVPSELAEQNNQNRPHARKRVRFENVCPKSVMYLLLKIGGPKATLFDDFATLAAYIFTIKHDIHNPASVFKTTRMSQIISKCHELWSPNCLKLDRSLYPSFVNSALYFIARLRRRGSANGTQPNFAKRWTVNRANNLP